MEKKDTNEKSTTKKKIVKKVTRKKIEPIEEIIESPVAVKKETVSFNLIEVISIILITGLIVSVCSGLIVFRNYDKINKTNKNEENSTALSELVESYNHITKSYVNEVDEKELSDAAIEAMYDFLGDKYSNYLDKDTTTDLEDKLEGKYQGIGVEITYNESEEILINRVFENSPAEKAGLKAGDIIIWVDGEDTKGKTTAQVADKMKNNPKSEFDLTYRRDKEEITITLKRSTVYIPAVTSEIKEGIGYIKIDTFSAVATDQMTSELNKLNRDNISKLIIDVRGNSGGYLSTAKNIADMFIEKGKIIYQLKGKDNKIEKYYDKDKLDKSYEIIVLINGGSASASEILAAALRDSAGARLLGAKSYGKGTVQETDKLSSGAMVKYTTAYWLTPNGESINEIGLSPDIKVEIENFEVDAQLNKAIELLKK